LSPSIADRTRLTVFTKLCAIAERKESEPLR
jgi:hypothetical protein